ncbi:MAG: GHMP kinase, partial [Nitrospinota bacterium]
NLAVNLYAKTRIKLRRDSKIIIESKDLKKGIKFDSIDKLSHNHSLSLITKILSFFKPEYGLHIETDCEAPAGAGLAGSSALNIALCTAMNKLTGKGYSKKELITIAKNIESQVIGVPTGEQDYYPAMFGGLNIIDLSPEGVTAEKVKIACDELEQRITLCYSGASRNSGINNWEILKRHINGSRKIFKNLEAIRRTAMKMKSAIIDLDRFPSLTTSFDRLAELVGEEWENRKRLWRGVSTPAINRLIEIAMKNGAASAKVCGAGGGGCIIFLSEPKRQEKIKEAVKRAGGMILDYKVDRKGAQMKVSERQSIRGHRF